MQYEGTLLRPFVEDDSLPLCLGTFVMLPLKVNNT